MKKNVRKSIILCLTILVAMVFLLSPQYVYASNIKYNKKVSGSVNGEAVKTYDFEVKDKQQIELIFQCSSVKYGPEISVGIYKINGRKDTDVETWLEKNLEAYWDGDIDEDLYNEYEFDPEDKLIDSDMQYFFDISDSIKLKKTLSKGKYYVEIQNEDYKKVKYQFTLKQVLREATSIKLNTNEVSLRYGKTKQLKPTDKKGVTINHSVVKYSTSNKKVATVSKTGKITAKNAGKCKITAKLKNGKKAICKVTVPKLNLQEKLKQKQVYGTVSCVNDRMFYNECWINITNHSNKDIVYTELQIVQYDNKWDKLYRPYSYYYVNKTIKKKSTKSYSFYVNDDTVHARACIIKVHYKDGTTWTNPLYKSWKKKYL